VHKTSVINVSLQDGDRRRLLRLLSSCYNVAKPQVETAIQELLPNGMYTKFHMSLLRNLSVDYFIYSFINTHLINTPITCY